jgi:hypothetical protein
LHRIEAFFFFFFLLSICCFCCCIAMDSTGPVPS